MKFWLLLFLASTAWAQVNAPQTPVEKQVDAKLSPSLQPVADVPGLPRVLLIGDSVSIGYTLRVRAALRGRANVHRVPTNAGPSSKGVAEIDRWLGDGKWDVIHFNFGLHDVRLLKPDEINVPRDRYEANLRAIVTRLQRTGATLIWATTTPAPPKPRAGQYPRNPDDIAAYNAIAARTMAEHGVRINDLHAAVLPRIRELQPEDDVHFNSQGSDVLGAQVAAAIAAVLPALEAARSRPPTLAAEPKITQVEPRVWSCEYESRTLGLPMRFLVVLPEGATRTSAPLPTIYFLHGRGRHERSLFEYESTRQRVMASPCAVVLPRGRDGWYVNSPVIPADRYADHLDEVMALAERHFPLGRGAGSRAIGGWSMGGYGAAYTAARRGDFAALAPIIGILDYPRAPVADPGQNYALQPRFGIDPAAWRLLNPRLLLPRLRATPLFVAYADKAAERQMNEDFIADARAAGVPVEVLKMSGGHTFPMVEQGLPAAFSFMEKHLIARHSSGGPAPGEFVTVRGLAELRGHLARNGAKVKLAPGAYRLDSAGAEIFLHFTGSDSHFDFTGVRLEVDTAQFARFKAGINLLQLSGDRIVLQGLELETLGDWPPPGGCRAISLLGRGVVVRDVSLRLSGSYPYGYGSFFGIGSGATINPQKQNGIRIGGIDNQVINCRVVMRCFGHAIFLRGAQNALVRDCTVEGALRKTDDILAESSGPAFALGFKQYTGPRIPAGEMISLSEDGIRAYPNDPATGRRTQDIRVENCRVSRMRRGICLAYAGGRNHVTGCEVTESERVAYHIQSDTTIRDSRGDALYSQILDISTAGAKRSDVDLTVLDSRDFYGHTVLATIGGTGHQVTLREAAPGFLPPALSVEVGQARSGPGEVAAAVRAAGIELNNINRAAVVLHPTTSGCTVASPGQVTDRGSDNRVNRAYVAVTEVPPARHPTIGTRFEPTDIVWDQPVYRNTFDDAAALREWRLEGGKAMAVRDGRLILESPPGATSPEDNRGHLVCWLTREIPPDFLLEFAFRPHDRKQGLAIVFFSARGDGGRSIFDPSLKPRDGTFLQYLRGDLDNYHISYWAGDRGTANVRKNRGFQFVGVGDDLVAAAPAEVFQTIRVYKRGGKIRLTVDGVIAAAFEDDGKTHGPVWTHSGWIGLRQMGHTLRGEYEHVTVWPLRP